MMKNIVEKTEMTLDELDTDMNERIGRASTFKASVVGLYDTRAEIRQLDDLQKLRRKELEWRLDRGHYIALKHNGDTTTGRIIVRTKDRVEHRTTVNSANAARWEPEIFRACTVAKPFVSVKREGYTGTRPTLLVELPEKRSLELLMDRYQLTAAALRELRSTEKDFVAKLHKLTAEAQWTGAAVKTADGWVFGTTQVQFDPKLMEKNYPEVWAKLAETKSVSISGHVRIISASPSEIDDFRRSEGE